MEQPTFFKDPFNPTSEELKKWAYGDYYAPEQDFELFVMEDPFLALTFASDDNCPTKQFFLESLYTWFGDNIKGGRVKDSKVQEVLRKAQLTDNRKISKLVNDVSNLIANPDTYTYENWGLGSLLAK